MGEGAVLDLGAGSVTELSHVQNWTFGADALLRHPGLTPCAAGIGAVSGKSLHFEESDRRDVKGAAGKGKNILEWSSVASF